MNRPLALIEGDLALPIPRPFDVLPPPFGSRRRQARISAQREAQPAPLAATQQGGQNAMQGPASAARRGRFPPDVKFFFFYKLPPQRDYSQRFAEQLAEARSYLEMGRVRPSSTRSDRVLGALIFAGCSIVLAWLLATCTTHDTDKATARSAPSAASSAHKVTAPGALTPLNATPQTTQRNTPTQQRVEYLVPHAAARVPVRQDASGRPTKAHQQSPIVRLSQPQVDQRPALKRTADLAARPFASKQAEWMPRPSSAADSAERGARRDWAAQQRPANITTRASMRTPDDTDWNAHMTQRRITDNPDAFQTGHTEK